MTAALTAGRFPDDSTTERLCRVYGPKLLDAHRRAYLSTPITTGPRFIDWWDSTVNTLGLDSSKVAGERFASVIAPNLADARAISSQVERRLRIPVINPAELEKVEGWEQKDYHSFWSDVIRRYVDTVVFSDGWELSTGCVIEYRVARCAGLAVLDERFDSLDDDAALKLVREAINELRDRGLDDAPHSRLVRDLSENPGGSRSEC